MDGLLIDSEEMVGRSINEVLKRYDRPPLTPSIRAKLIGIPDSSNSDMFHDWAQLPISRDQWAKESAAQMALNFTKSRPLPGAQGLLSKLSRSYCASTGDRVELALASSSPTHYYKLKMTVPETKRLMDSFSESRKILGDDPRVPRGRGKPAPDIYLAALQALNSTLAPGKPPILASECLAFEDSVAGVESARRAGMRVVWVPHELVADRYRGREGDMVAGRSGAFDAEDERQLGKVPGGMGEMLRTLEDFDCKKYGIEVAE
ncbi:hypothetical protein K4F52_005135 [Lecanicillium sp. MT-2017a]|nr:hypothetical protein K4F52_005135 [Lecanicillium sp. MT-2017a]